MRERSGEAERTSVDHHSSPCVYQTPNGLLYFGLRLHRIIAASNAGKSHQSDGASDFNSRQVELIKAIHARASDKCTYDFRILSHPNPDVPALGHIVLAIICRMDGVSISAAEAQARAFSRMMDSNFPEYEFAIIPSDDLPAVLNPFTVREAVSLSKRIDRDRLDTAESRRPNGWRPVKGDAKARENQQPYGQMLRIHPYVPTGVSFDSLFSQLLLQPSQYAISVRVHPTCINTCERTFIYDLIATCERYAQANLGSTEDDEIDHAAPTFKERAAANRRGLSNLLAGLSESAALVTVTIASDGPVSGFLASAVGSVLTACYKLKSIDSAIAEIALGSLDIVTSEHPLLPVGTQRLPFLLNSIEAAAMLLLPPVGLTSLEGVEARGWQRTTPPRNLSMRGVLLGKTVERGSSREVRISAEDRGRHVYAIGQTGTGKSTLLKTMILDDIGAGESVVVLDPHGDLFREILGQVPESRREDVIIIDPTDVDFPVGLNLLDVRDEKQRHFVVQEFTGILSRMLRDTYGDAIANMTGPIFFQHVRMNLMLVMSDPDKPATLMDFYRVLSDEDAWREWTPLKRSDSMLDNWVQNVLPSVDYNKQTSDGISMGSYVTSKFESFLFDPMLRSIFDQKRSTISFRHAIDNGKIILVNLAKGELSESNSSFLGMIVLAMLQAAALSRVDIAQSSRRPVYVYVDEFQNIATENFVTLLSEGRKFGVSLTLANQFVTQLHNAKIAESIFGNVGSVVAFRMGAADSERLERELVTVNRNDLLMIPNWHAYIKTIVRNETVRAFEMQTLPPQGTYCEQVATAVRKASRAAYGTPMLKSTSSDTMEIGVEQATMDSLESRVGSDTRSRGRVPI